MLEAACAGLPLVVVDDLAFDGIIENNVNGFALPLSVLAFSDAILKLLSDQDLREKMGKASNTIALKNFNGTDITTDLVALYNIALSKHEVSRRIIKKVNKVALARIIRMKRGIDKILNAEY